MSTARPTGRRGEFPLVDDIAERCATVAQKLRDQGLDAKEYYINYEEAVRDGRTLLCPAIGIIGNAWAKSLFYLGGWARVFTPYLHEGVYYEESPRNGTDWFWPIISCAAWVNRGKGNG